MLILQQKSDKNEKVKERSKTNAEVLITVPPEFEEEPDVSEKDNTLIVRMRKISLPLPRELPTPEAVPHTPSATVALHSQLVPPLAMATSVPNPFATSATS